MQNSFFRRSVRLLALAVLPAAVSAWAQKPALEFSQTTNASQVGTSFVTGYQFAVLNPITVTSLGAVLDHSASKAIFGALPTSMRVGLWDSSQKLLATTTVYDTDPISGNFNYSTITPVALSPGQNYVVAGLLPSGKSTLSNVPELATDPQVKYLGPRSMISSELAFPATDVIGERNGYFAASFAFTARLALVNYRLVSQTPGNSRYTADLLNSGAAYAAVMATVTSSDPAVTISPGQNTLSFTPVPANSTAATKGTFMVKGDSPVDFATLQATFTFPARRSAYSNAVVANAGSDQSAIVGEEVSLSGSESSYGDAAPTYSWTFTSRPGGSAATLIASNSEAPSFVPDIPGTYVVALTVSEGSASSIDSVTVNAAAAKPAANAGADITIVAGSRVALDGSGSTPGKGKMLQYSWELTAAPEGFSAALEASNTASPSFEAPGPGTYQVRLVVNDGIEDSAPESVTVTAVNGPLAGDVVVPAAVKVNSRRFTPMQIQLSKPAPPGGVSVSLVSSDTSKVTVSPAVLVFPEGETVSMQARVAGVKTGAAAVTVSGAGLTDRTIAVNVQADQEK